jgi:predicted PurR-regulated permease PerM
VTNPHQPLPHRYSMTALTAALVLGLVLCYFIALPFLPSLVWSMTLAVLFAPVERLLHGRHMRPAFSVSLTMLLAAAIVVAPAVLVTGALVNEVIGSAELIGSVLSEEQWRQLSERHPWLSPAINVITRYFDPQELLQTLANQLGTWSASLLQGSLTGIINLLLTFYFLFYLLRDRSRLLAATSRMLPLSTGEFRTLAHRIESTIFASVYGTVVVAGLQGLLGGMMFWWLGLPSPVFWGVVMGLLAVVPFLGAFFVWVPAVIVLLLNGQFLSALMLAAWGTIVVGLIDNIVYPILVGQRLAIHSMVSFIAIVGGLILFGPHGIVLGPIIVAGAFALLEIWRNRLDLEQAEAH